MTRPDAAAAKTARQKRRRAAWRWTLTLLAAWASGQLVANLLWFGWAVGDGQRWALASEGGRLCLAWMVPSEFESQDVTISGPTFEVSVLQGNWLTPHTIIPAYEVSTGVRFLSVPLWMLAFGFGLPALHLWRVRPRRLLPHFCPCGYDLSGNVSGVCPECGRPIETASPARAGAQRPEPRSGGSA